MTLVIINRGASGAMLNGGPHEHYGCFLQAYLPDFAGGVGAAFWTRDPEQAMRFDTPEEVFALLDESPAARLMLPDGTPNRPIRAYSLEIRAMLDMEGNA